MHLKITNHKVPTLNVRMIKYANHLLSFYDASLYFKTRKIPPASYISALGVPPQTLAFCHKPDAPDSTQENGALTSDIVILNAKHLIQKVLKDSYDNSNVLSSYDISCNFLFFFFPQMKFKNK